MSNPAEQGPIDETLEGFAPPDFSGPEPEDVAPEPEPEEEPKTELTPEERDMFRTLMTIGRRQKTVHLFDFPVVIRSLTCDDHIRIGDAVKKHRDSQGFGRAYQVAYLAASVLSVEGVSWENTLTPLDADALFWHKYEKAKAFYPLVASKLYDEAVNLDVEFAELAEKLGKL